GAARLAMCARLGPILPPTPSTMMSPSKPCNSRCRAPSGRDRISSRASTFAMRPGKASAAMSDLDSRFIGSKAPLGQGRPTVEPWRRLLEGPGRLQHQKVAVTWADQMQADRQALGRHTTRQAGGRLAGQVEGRREGIPFAQTITFRRVARRI